MRSRYRDAALTLLRSLVYHVKRGELRLALRSKGLRYRRRQRRLAMVNVAYRTYVDMGLRTLKFLFSHRYSSL
jgi:hypothetical protein